VSKDNREVPRNSVEEFNEENPGVRYTHPELYIKYLEDVIEVYYRTYTLRNQEWQND
jgi:hypothetical protein